MSGGWTVVDSASNKSIPIQGLNAASGVAPYSTPAPSNLDPVGKFRVSQPQALIDTDFEYGTQPTKWESIALQNNRQSMYYIAQQPNTGVTSIAGDGSTPTITVLTSNTTSISVGSPIYIQNSNSTAANGWWYVTAVTNGVISTMGSDANGYGNWVEVKHEDGTASRYGHLSQIGVSRGQKVVAGQVVGKSGGKAGAPGAGNSTGPHLHFEILNSSGVKVNPAPYLSGAPAAPSNSSLTASAVAGPRAISGQTMSAAKQTTASLRKGPLSSQSLTVISSPSLSSSLTTSGFNEDLGGPIQAMNIGSTHSSSSSKNVVINLQMKVHIAQGSVQETDRMVKMIGKRLSESDVLKKIGSAL